MITHTGAKRVRAGQYLYNCQTLSKVSAYFLRFGGDYGFGEKDRSLKVFRCTGYCTSNMSVNQTVKSKIKHQEINTFINIFFLGSQSETKLQ